MSLATFVNDAVCNWRQRGSGSVDRGCKFPELAQLPPDARRLIRDRRYCLVLSSEHDLPFEDVSVACAWKALEHDMAFIPGGEVCLNTDTIIASGDEFEMVASRGESTPVQALYLDRNCVTNADYAKFVHSDGYSNPCYWPEAILPNVLQFIDSTGQAGPKYWAHGNPPPDKEDHPVVGVCWYEANAYAAWAGKRLPSAEQWQQAGTWLHRHGDGTEPRYPWGNGFDPSKANTWASRCGDTVPVDAFAAGNTPNGVRQLIGNVWQWIDAQYDPPVPGGISLRCGESMAEIRGGAFDTYFHSQATCQFRTGQGIYFRGPNVGFRCGIGLDVLPLPADHSNPDVDASE